MDTAAGRVRRGPAGRKPRVVPDAGQDFRITDDRLGEGSEEQRFRWNVEAIQLLKQLREEGRSATPEERDTLSRYTGWGWAREGINPFAGKIQHYTSAENIPHSAYYDDTRRAVRWRDELKPLLTEGEWKDAKASVTNAHYTSPSIIRAMWDGVKRLGFTGGMVDAP